ncbi:hypothetical protein E2C01_089953 [Portunus trituberculatus]|uniref:Uncharacterized protein n=1 Tax=Portunus trituberculatus TaxID=210409 RepID=A0A5B7JIZ9_PORTR|nr:hypothetical protein [Portunus trituberculatus]
MAFPAFPTISAEFHRRISEVREEFRSRISDLQAEFYRVNSASGNGKFLRCVGGIGGERGGGKRRDESRGVPTRR